MKEMYKSPELELICLAPAERIATESKENVDFGALGGGANFESVNPGSADIDIPLI